MTLIGYSAAGGASHARFVTYLKRWLPRALQQVRRAPGEVSIALVGDAKMAQLHVQFMNVPGSTDVLTFELDHDARGRVIAGEVVVCVPYAVREAKRRGIDPKREVLLYALHGILHLSGFDDLTPADHARMHREEDRILKKIGIGATFLPVSDKWEKQP